jgi:predicted DNA-binding antitoxin AbrB/MazE fold protein
MSKIDLNQWAQDVANREGKKVNVNIAQIKEVISLFLDKLADASDEEVKTLLDRRRAKKS